MRIGDLSITAAFAAVLVLSGCNSTEDALRPLANDVGTSTQQTQDGISLPTATRGSVQFTPIIGAPIEAVTPLSRQLGAEARTRGFAIRGSSEQNADHVLKGYLSAFNDGKQTAVIFVWDVLDPAGNRLHRIQGQENVPGAASDPWASVPSPTMERIATRIFEEYETWLRQTPG